MSESETAIRNAIIDSFNRYAEGVDSKNWTLVRSCFADQVVVDYGDLSASLGEPGVPVSADDWVSAVRGVISGFDVTRHAITNHRFDLAAQPVCARAYLDADHVIFADPEIQVVQPENVVTLVGEYTNYYELQDGCWKIVRSALTSDWTSGNVELLQEAVDRASCQ